MVPRSTFCTCDMSQLSLKITHIWFSHWFAGGTFHEHIFQLMDKFPRPCTAICVWHTIQHRGTLGLIKASTQHTNKYVINNHKQYTWEWKSNKTPKSLRNYSQTKNEEMEVDWLGFFFKCIFSSINSDKYHPKGISKLDLPGANEG